MTTPIHPASAGKIAVVTGASSGIGAATARRLADEGFHVVVAARRRERLDALASEIGGTAATVDVTDQLSVDELAAQVQALDGQLRLVVNNAGGAKGMDPVESADLNDWRWMYEVNVLGAARVTQTLLPQLEASGNGHMIIIGSAAGHSVYEGGGGYCGAKAAVSALAQALRLELSGRPIRITEIAPGMVHTEEFSLIRFGGDSERADAVYAGVPNPLVAEDIADCVAWAATRPAHVNVDLLIVRPRAQAANHKVYREKL